MNFIAFLVSLLDNSKSIKRKEISKGVEKVVLPNGGPLQILLRHPQEDLQDNTCIDIQRSCVDDEHVSPSAPSQVLLTWHCYMWLHVMYDV